MISHQTLLVEEDVWLKLDFAQPLNFNIQSTELKHCEIVDSSPLKKI